MKMGYREGRARSGVSHRRGRVCYPRYGRNQNTACSDKNVAVLPNRGFFDRIRPSPARTGQLLSTISSMRRGWIILIVGAPQRHGQSRLRAVLFL